MNCGDAAVGWKKKAATRCVSYSDTRFSHQLHFKNQTASWMLCSGRVAFEDWRTGLRGTLWQVKSQTQRSSSASSSHEPPNVRQRSCSQLSTPEPDPPDPQSAWKCTASLIKHYKHAGERCLFISALDGNGVLVLFLFKLSQHLYIRSITELR